MCAEALKIPTKCLVITLVTKLSKCFVKAPHIENSRSLVVSLYLAKESSLWKPGPTLETYPLHRLFNNYY